jgi:anti-sigma regulatory factor (Ser/Thr protein kinase)
MAGLELRAAADVRAPGLARTELKTWLRARAWPQDDIDDLLLAVSEAVSNAADHAYADALSAAAPMFMLTAAEIICPGTRHVELRVQDFGRWRPESPSPSFRGRGLAMIEALVDTCVVDCNGEGTTVRMTSRPVPLHEDTAFIR